MFFMTTTHFFVIKKAEVDKIEAGDECGVGLIDFEEFLAGDIIESYVE